MLDLARPYRELTCNLFQLKWDNPVQGLGHSTGIC